MALGRRRGARGEPCSRRHRCVARAVSTITRPAPVAPPASPIHSPSRASISAVADFFGGAQSAALRRPRCGLCARPLLAERALQVDYLLGSFGRAAWAWTCAVARESRVVQGLASTASRAPGEKSENNNLQQEDRSSRRPRRRSRHVKTPAAVRRRARGSCRARGGRAGGARGPPTASRARPGTCRVGSAARERRECQSTPRAAEYRRPV